MGQALINKLSLGPKFFSAATNLYYWFLVGGEATNSTYII
jgi:hypothetical protein